MIVEIIEQEGMDLNVEKNVSKILVKGDIRLEDTEAMIWN